MPLLLKARQFMPEKSALINEIRDMLSECDMFNMLQSSELQLVASYFSTNKIPKGKIIFSEGTDIVAF